MVVTRVRYITTRIVFNQRGASIKHEDRVNEFLDLITEHTKNRAEVQDIEDTITPIDSAGALMVTRVTYLAPASRVKQEGE